MRKRRLEVWLLSSETLGHHGRNQCGCVETIYAIVQARF